MIVAKQVADLITWARALLALWIPWLGISQGNKSLPLVVFLMIVNWTADSVDGVLARRSSVQYRSWIGDRDLEIDMFIAAGVLGYLTITDLILWQIAAFYMLIWLVVFWRFGILRILGILFQAPIFGWFVVSAVIEVPSTGLWIIIWIAAAVIVTWPKFPKVIIPTFLNDMKSLITRSGDFSDHWESR